MLEVSRRTVMAFGAGTAGALAIATLGAPAAVGAPGALGTRVPAFTPAPPVGPPVRSHFADHIGETFIGTTETGSTPLVLTAILDLPGAMAGDETCFSLIFTAPARAELAGTIYAITHPVAPAATLFLGPVGEPKKRELQALVNRTR